MFKKTKRTYKHTKKRSKTKKNKPSSPYQVLRTDFSDLPSWYKDGLPKLKRTIKHKYKPITHNSVFQSKSISPENSTFRDVLYPAWVGKIPYPKKVDLIEGRLNYGLYDSGVAISRHQYLWKDHLELMKKELPSIPKIPATKDLWTEEQKHILREFYKNTRPSFLVKHSVDGKQKSRFDLIIEQMGPYTVDSKIRENYVLTTTEYLMGETLIDLKLKPHTFKLKKNTYLFHGSIVPDLDFDTLIKPIYMVSDHVYNNFIFFGLSATISLWYTAERFSQQALLQKNKSKNRQEFEAYLYVYKLTKDMEFLYIEDDIISNQKDSKFKIDCAKKACLHPQFAFHSYEQLNRARGPVDLDWELTIPIDQLNKNKMKLVGKYYIDVLELLKHSSKNINQFDPISTIDFKNLID